MTDAYSRLYHRFAKEYPAVYSDDRALAWWVRLLMLADAAWPMRPPLPRSVRKPVLVTLTSPHGDRPALVSCDGDTYTVLGLDAERTRRANAGRKGAAVRWESERNADGNANAMPRRDETSTDKQKTEIPPPPAERGRRANGSNPRSNGSAPRQQAANPRSKGTSTRQKRVAEKRGPIGLSTHEILRRAAANGGSS